MKNILVFGGTGYVGKSVVEYLIKNNYRPILFVRNKNLNDFSKILLDKIEIIEGDINNLENYKNEIKNSKPFAIIYLIGLISENKNNLFINAHYNFAIKAYGLGKEIGVSKFLYMSANGAREDGTDYQRTKYKMERFLKENNLSYVIFRPSLILGPSQDYHFILELKKLLRFPIVPVLGSGNYKISPVFRNDLAEIIIKSIESEKVKNRILLIGGETITFNELLKTCSEKFKIKRFYIHIPISISKLLVAIIDKIPNTPITKDQFKMLTEGNFVDDKSVWNDLNVKPKDLSYILDQYK